MSSLVKLSLQGIRSYNPKEPQSIVFEKPVTIILGQNGSGKTTIIEALKNVTTGLFPANSDSGKYFLFDPRITGVSEVHGKIVLDFVANNGELPVTVARFMKLEQKKEKQSLTTEDFTIATEKENGEVQSTSKKCSDNAVIVPELLGISKSMLENVVFCHQEDSEWPLSDSATLKKKFDAIFSSTNYTKALEHLKDIKKKEMEKLKKIKGLLETELNNLNEKKKKNLDKEEEKKKISQIQREMDNLDKKLRNLNDEIGDFERIEQKVVDLTKQISEKKTRHQLSKENCENLRSSLSPDISDPTDKLIEARDKNSSNIVEQQKEKSKIESSIAQNTSERKNYEQQLKNFAREVTQLETEKASFLKQKEGIIQEVVKLSKKNPSLASNDSSMIIDPENPQITDDKIESFLGSIKNEIAKQTKLLQQTKAKNLEEGNKLRNEISKLEAEINAVNTQKANSQKQIDLKKTEIREVESRLKKNLIDDDQIQRTKAEIEELQGKIIADKSNFDIDAMKTAIDRIKSEILETRSKIAQNEKELKSRETEQSAAAVLETHKKEKESAQAKLDNLIKEFTPKFEKALPNVDFPQISQISQMESTINTNLIEKQKLLTIASQKLAGADKKAITLKTKFDNINSELKKKRDIVEKNIKTIDEFCGDGETLPSLIEKGQKKINKNESDIQFLQGISKLYDSFIRFAKDTNKCQVCQRPLDDLDSFISLQTKENEGTPKKIQKKEETLKELRSRLDEIMEAKPLFDENERLLSKEIPDLEQQQANFSGTVQDAEKEAQVLKQQVEQLKIEEKAIQALVSSARGITIENKRMMEIQEKINQFQKKLDDMRKSANAAKNYEELKMERADLNKKHDMLTDQLSKENEQMNKRSEHLQSLNNELNKKEVELKLQEKKKEDAEVCKKQISALNEQLQTIQTEMMAFEQSMPSKKKEVEEKKTSLKDLLRAHASGEDSFSKRIFELNNDLQTIENKIEQCRDFAESNKEEKLREAEHKHEKHKILLQTAESDFEELSKQREKLTNRLQRQESIKTNIEANINYRKKLQELEEIKKEVQQLEKSLAAVYGDSQNESDVSKRTKEISKKRQIREELLREKSELIGRKKTLEDNISKCENSIKDPKYSKVEASYLSYLIQKNSIEAVIRDIEEYSKKLQLALVEFHSQKMDQINAIIQELWQKTYSGQDIDTVQIVADTVTKSARSTYSYRVVQKKGNVIIDFRGKCSAGQKVLACLIIRMAMAEAFCLNCGVFTLDEPTTNLDSNHITALANSLQAIIKERSSQSNFQFVIITHDQEFVQMLRSEYTDHCFEISKDSNGYSKIALKYIQDR